MPRGGPRKGAGRKLGPPSSTKGVRLSDETWLALAIIAERQRESQSRILERLIRVEHERLLRRLHGLDRMDQYRNEHMAAILDGICGPDTLEDEPTADEPDSAPPS